jgi:hypothetical protein
VEKSTSHPHYCFTVSTVENFLAPLAAGSVTLRWFLNIFPKIFKR